MKCVEVYKELYHQEPFDVAFCPYRISPLGAHIDHQYGKINGLAIDKGIHMAYHPKQNGVVELQSLNFPKRAQFFVSAVPEEKQGDWADHLRGAAKMLGEKYRLKVGLSGIIEGSLPIGGLSSSASVIICFLSALCKVNGIHLEPMEMILTAKAAENQYVGVSCGKLDQSCEVLSKKDHLLYLDTKDDSYELIPTSEKMKPYKVAIFFSGLERSLKNSKYNLRQDECKAAAYALMGFAGMDYDTFANTRLRNVPYEVFEAYKDRLPELWRRRAEHYYSEFARAEKGAELWRKGDLEGYGQLVFESGKSSMHPKTVWRVNPDGEVRDTYRKLSNVFQMEESAFFTVYAAKTSAKRDESYLNAWKAECKKIAEKIPELPLSNAWVAKTTSALLPKDAVLHFGILNSLRSWNFFEIGTPYTAFSNTGGFGIDGCVSSLVGGALADPKHLHFGFVGDLAMFYDLNSLGNRHVTTTIRLLVVNNGRGQEFRNYNHPAAAFGEQSDGYIAAAGHYGKQSHELLKHYAEDLGFTYLAASNKEEFLQNVKVFTDARMTDKPILFEVFTDTEDENAALKAMHTIESDATGTAKKLAKEVLGDKGFQALKNLIKK